MGSLSKQDVMEAIQRQYAPKEKQKDKLTDKLRGMLNPRGPVGAAVNRQEYLRYVEERQQAGEPALDYDSWARSR